MATKRLILLRHAKSDWRSGVATDFERPLNQRGRHDAPRVGRWLHFNAMRPDVICCSSAKRARETLELIATELNISQTEVQFMGELYHANEAEITAIVEEQLLITDTVMIVGHNPGFEMVLLNYCPDTAMPKDRKLMTTACVAVIDFEETPEPGRGNLKYLRRPD